VPFNIKVQTDAKSLGTISSGAGKAGDDVKKLEKTSGKAGKSMIQSFRNAARFLAPLGIALGARQAVRALTETIKSASNLEESINAVNVVFGEGATQILAFGENAARSVGLANSEFNQLSTVTGALLQDVGLNMKQVAELTTLVVRRASDLASVFNTEVTDALLAFNSAIRGESEPIRRYSGDVTEATLRR